MNNSSDNDTQVTTDNLPSSMINMPFNYRNALIFCEKSSQVGVQGVKYFLQCCKSGTIQVPLDIGDN